MREDAIDLMDLIHLFRVYVGRYRYLSFRVYILLLIIIYYLCIDHSTLSFLGLAMQEYAQRI